MMMSSMSSGLAPVRSISARMTCAMQIVGPHPGQRALVGRRERRTDIACDDGLGHWVCSRARYGVARRVGRRNGLDVALHVAQLGEGQRDVGELLLELADALAGCASSVACIWRRLPLSAS